MATITLKGNPINTCGNLPKVGDKAPSFTLTRQDMSDVSLDTYSGKSKILNIFVSVDTPVCASSVKAFTEKATLFPNAAVLHIAADLPFAQKRFCGSAGIENAETLSTFRSSFGKDFGVEIVDGGLKGLLARAIIVLDKDNRVLHTELVPEIAQEPNYEKALAALKS